MTNWTPGPWKACKAGECQCGMVWSEPHDCHIVTVFGDKENRDRLYVIGAAHHESGDSKDMIYFVVPEDVRNANAKLVAAAPDLYAALEALCSGGRWDEPEAWAEADAALKKARGETKSDTPQTQSDIGIPTSE